MIRITLKDISEVVNKYSDLLSNILNLDVEVVDNNLERIAGSGIYKSGIGKNIEAQGYVYKAALLSGKAQVIENPGKDILCKDCKDKDNCKEEMEICVPIKYGDMTFGVIGFVCSTKEQKEYLINNFRTIMSFLEQISDFISIKIIEQNEVLNNKDDLEFLNQIVNSVEDGIITTDSSNKINLINNKGIKILKLKPSIIGEIIRIEETEDYLPSGRTYKLYINNIEYRIVGKVIHNYINQEICSKILVFNEIKQLNEDAVNLTHGNNKITCDAIVGESLVMKQMKEKIKRIAYSKSTVLITGESGTGKELVARAIHAEGNLKNKPFIAINCGAIPESLLESELFGYVKGAFSGANISGRVGKFELANKGIIFLDEIGDMPIYLQVKLLRVLQERTLVKIGSNQLINLDIRVIAATNKDLKKLVEEGKFREDLYYRLNVIPFEVPPLRDREGDIELIMYELINKYNKIFNKYVHTVNGDVIKKLKEYPWKGNVRELENLVEFIVSISHEDGIISLDMLPKTISNYNKDEDVRIDNKIDSNKQIKKLKDIEIEYIEKVLDLCGRDTLGKKEAAKKLGIGIATLYRKIDEK
ncbi:Transcriptional regulator containing PAS, AAA-type ATPase, and DNA-binding Fis domains [Clostridium cavendishii DSM 21758]|uniref:Transcriptional regulator containing PAS, AAA-type ATPase, and DNA-binding Fis domains n=1 Tax=Clostridium cavendishii DSM 21758 TaxID=1121302 RepID=A0A1M6DME5_9CLOT|nr:sigma 54-interacting transcriptional regulator [Clostridium cavendishii]SHI74249.1 Transcriptional regulator containing PAS, AAA-type ATPase, and DNA-binding Fis domains [Clostridium cavendishii DSM 21758]